MNTKHWDEVYKKKADKEVSWFQEVPEVSLQLIDEFQLDKSASVIDIGGGDSRLVDHLLNRGFSDISILDISAVALDKAKDRLKDKLTNIHFIASDITQFKPTKKYKLWHDRATFHFLTELDQVQRYLEIAHDSLEVGGYLIISTFSKSGPEKCSGLNISQYSQEDLKKLFGRFFSNIKCLENTHETPWGAKQDFVYCGFRKD
jgi:ubiquinone/menaquinone biosynthesis C-methylase UbiE